MLPRSFWAAVGAALTILGLFNDEAREVLKAFEAAEPKPVLNVFTEELLPKVNLMIVEPTTSMQILQRNNDKMNPLKIVKFLHGLRSDTKLPFWPYIMNKLNIKVSNEATDSLHYWSLLCAKFKKYAKDYQDLAKVFSYSYNNNINLSLSDLLILYYKFFDFLLNF